MRRLAKLLLALALIVPRPGAAQQTSRDRPEKTESAQASAGQTVNVRRAIDPSLVVSLIAPVRLNVPEREALLDTLLKLLRVKHPDSAAVHAALVSMGKGITAPTADLAVATLLTFVRAEEPGGQTAILAAATAAGTTDRLYSTVEVFNFASQYFSARIVSATAVSNADTAITSQDSTALALRDRFRQR